jgi:hypothetical protein
MEQYQRNSYRMTLLEIQKMAYFLQETGEPLRLQYGAGHYGPYATNLGKVLEILEGHYIRGYGDRDQPEAEIQLLPDAVTEADAWLTEESMAAERVHRVLELVDGFETPYGLELLASVHWAAIHREPRAETWIDALEAIKGWSVRKRLLFQPQHVRVAWEQLAAQGWLPDAPCATQSLEVADRREAVGE